MCLFFFYFVVFTNVVTWVDLWKFVNNKYIYYSLEALKSPTNSRVISFIDRHPQFCIKVCSSKLNMLRIASAPLSPHVANPQRMGLPTMTAVAPSAIAFAISDPRLMPPSRIISILLPLVASTILGRHVMVAGAVSTCLPP